MARLTPNREDPDVTAMKRPIGSALLAALLVTAGLVGCGRGGHEAGNGNQKPAATPPEETRVAAKAGAVTVTYYYLPG